MPQHAKGAKALFLCKIVFFSIFFMTALYSPSPASSMDAVSAQKKAPLFKLADHYDVVIAGGGIGGIAAAIQAARLGVSVLVIEPTDWIGGQATAAGVATMDDLSRQKSGIYLEFIDRLKDFYSSKGKSMGTCYWDSRSVAFEPSLGQKILYEMIDQTRQSNKKPFDILLMSSVTAVKKDKKTVTGVTIKNRDGHREIKSRILIDATEYGDILPLAKVDYRSGNSATPFLAEDSFIQDITWVAVIRKYPAGVPMMLRPLQPLPGYERAKRNYESYVTKNGKDFKGIYPVEVPVNFVSHNAYRGLPDSASPWNYDADVKNRKNISKTGVNWGNDYPGKDSWNGRMGLPIQYLEDKVFRAQIEKEAFLKTLHFIYYMQNELDENWGIADDEYNSSALPDFVNDLPEEWQEVARRMPPIPYVRESRRLVGAKTLTSEQLLKNSLSYRDGQTNHEFEDAVAIGGYILDLHGANTDAETEFNMNEKASSVHTHRPRGPFQVPLGILIPEKMDGFLVAEKNLSMSRLSAGALRLQPICMMVGQAAGALAALSVKNNMQPRQLPPVRVQHTLLKFGVLLSLNKYSDVPSDHPFRAAVQIGSLHQLLEPSVPPHAPSYNISDLDDPVLAMAIIKGTDKGVFGIDDMLSAQELEIMMTRARKASGTQQGSAPQRAAKPDQIVTRGMLAEALKNTFGFTLNEHKRSSYFVIPESHQYAQAVNILTPLGILDIYKAERDFHPARPVTRGEALELTVRAMVIADISMR